MTEDLQQPETRFVLLSLARSGTTVTARTLARYPSVYAHAAPFTEGDRWEEFVLPEVLQAHPDVDPNADPTGFVETLLSFTPGPSVVGFTIWRHQKQEVCTHLIGRADVKKIILERENILACYASREQSRSSGLWHRMDTGKRGSWRKPEMRLRRRHVQRTDAPPSEHSSPVPQGWERDVPDVRYTDLTTGGLARIGAFPGLEDFTPTPDLSKINSSDTVSRFNPVHHDEIRATLEEIGRPDRAHE